MQDTESTAQPTSSNCVSCGGARGAAAYCAYCGALFPDSLGKAEPRAKLVSLAAKYRVKRYGTAVEISWRWWSIAHLLLIPFALVWNSMVFSIGDWHILLSDPASLFPMPLLHMLVGMAVPVYAVICLVSQTRIRADRHRLRIVHVPLPIKRGLSLPTGEIQQIFVSKAQRHDKHSSWNVPVLQLVTKSGRRHELMKGQSEVEFSDYESLRQNLLQALGIAAAPAVGAIDG